jgi:hypothetical protein
MVLSWFAIFFLVAVAIMVVKGLANPRSRPIVVGLLFIGVSAVFFLGFASVRQARMTESQLSVAAIESPQQPPGYPSDYSTAPPPPGYSPRHSTEAMRMRKSKSSAASAQVAKSTKPDNKSADKSTKPATPPKDESDDDALQPPPAWVKAEPKKQGNVDVMTRQTDPYSTTIECERDVPAVLQSAALEYAQLLLGNNQARNVNLSDFDMRGLVREQWDEKRMIEVGGEPKEMHTLHLLIGFDQAKKQRILELADNVIVTQRLKRTGAMLGGLLGLLVLVWGGLSMTGNRQDANQVQEAVVPTTAPTATKSSVWIVVGVSIACLFGGVIAIATVIVFFA